MKVSRKYARAFTIFAVWCIMFYSTGDFKAAAGKAVGFLKITGPCHLKFPEDHGDHPGYRTEWWYYSGNLKDQAGNPYGFQLTFFRSQLSPPGNEKVWPRPVSAWRTKHVYFAHAAISDIVGGRHLQAETMSRQALGMAGVSWQNKRIHVFVKNWSADIAAGSHHLSAHAGHFSFKLSMTSEKPPVLHGDAGYSHKGSAPHRASCYYSLSRLKTTGTMTIQGKTLKVRGLGWMDHEFSTDPLEPGLSGWDWFGLQLSDHTELMIYLLRKTDGSLIEASSGTFIDTDGVAHHLTKDKFHIEVRKTWKSPETSALYPTGWHMKIPSLSLDLDIRPNLDDQEMLSPNTTNVIYWEGSVSVNGKKNDRSISGHGYIELTGYARAFDSPL